MENRRNTVSEIDPGRFAGTGHLHGVVIDVGGYGRFGAYSRVELERFFHLDDEDRRLVAAQRRDYNRLGFAVQVVTVRHLGMFLPDPLDVPPELVDYLAEQLDIDDPSCVKSYTDRRETRFEHAREIQPEYGLIAFSEVAPGLLRRQLDVVTAHGVAFEHEESALGLACVACPVFGPSGEVAAAISVTGPTSRFRPDAHSDVVRVAASAISATFARRGVR